MFSSPKLFTIFLTTDTLNYINIFLIDLIVNKIVWQLSPTPYDIDLYSSLKLYPTILFHFFKKK